MLVKLTATYQDGRTREVLVAEDDIRNVEPDDRAGSPSKSLVVTKSGFRYYAAETVTEIASRLGK